MASILDLFYRAALDDSQLQLDVVKSGEAAAKKFGSSWSRTLGSALKTTAFTALAGGAAIAGRGLLELNSIQADFQAQTGASADEADRAGKAINALGGRNLQGLREIGATLAAVYTDLHLAGQAADDTAERFLHYAEVTNQDSTQAVHDFKGILDAWNLTADDAAGIMDKLVVSHQRYGVSIGDDQAALQRLAPQLQALNLNIDDGIGLLNLFSQAGLDSSVATRALNTAVKNLKPGETFNDLIREITAIQDPTLRAQKAIEIFGARGGVGLANALRPGITSLNDFEISTTDAAGATDKANDAIEGTFSHQVELRIKAIGAAIIGLGQTFGPVLTGAAGLFSLLSATGLTGKLAAGLAGAFRAVASSSLVTGAIEFAAGKAATLYLRALIFGDAIAGALTAAWAAVTGSAAVVGAIEAAGTLAFGVFSAAVATAAIAAPIVIAALIIPKLQAALDPNDLHGQLNHLTDDLNSGKVVYVDAGRQSGAAYVDAASSAIGTQLGPAINDELERLRPGIATSGTGTGEKYGDAMVAAAKRGLAAGVGAIATVVSSSIAAHLPWEHIAREQANRLAGAVAQGIKDKRAQVDQAWADLLDAIKNQIKPATERAHLLGELASKALQSGLHSQDPEVRAQAAYTKQLIIDRLTELGANAHNIGTKGMEALRRAMHSKDPDIRAAALAIYHAATQPISKLPAAGTTAGTNFIKNVIKGMNSQARNLALAAAGLAGIARDHFVLSSPAKVGPWSKLGGPEGWGRRFSAFLAKGMVSGIPEINGLVGRSLSGPAFGRLPSIASALPSMAVAMGGSAVAGAMLSGGNVSIGAIHLHGIGSDVSPAAAQRFGQSVHDEVSRAFRQQGARIGVHPRVVP